tara:strand:- start:467 stop:1087 length:621 start_codon:yes stop_codon:yes gene_type:complete
MIKTIIHPTYFPTIEFFIHLLKSDNLIFEINDFYKKQTVRNRTSIYGSNGKLNLIIPVKFSSSNKDNLKDVKICYDTKWQKNHLKSIQIAYRSSPYFEFFEDYFFEIFEKKEKFLVDISIKSIEIIYEILEIDFKYILTKDYINDYKSVIDLRNLSNKKRKKLTNFIQPYPQVFDEKYGYISDLSIIDLIFNEGPSCLNYFNESNM